MGRPTLGRLGPFVGGMNTFSAPSAIGDNELVDCVNFEVDIDGSLVNRPPITTATSIAALTTASVSMIGSAILGSVSYVFASNASGVYAYSENTHTWSLVRANLYSLACVQVADLVFFLPVTGSVSVGGYWNGTTFTTDSNMPAAESVVYYKQRIWSVPGISATSTGTSHQLRFTEPINPAAPTPLVWTATNSIGINPGDGQRLVDVIIYNDNLMLFKQDSTYVFAFDVLPSDGAVKAVNTTIGASSNNCVVTHDNSSYVFHEGDVFEIVNYTFSKINTKLPLLVVDETVPAGTTRTTDVFLTLLGDRLIVRYYNRIYSYAIRTRTWGRWTSSTDTLQNFGPLVSMPVLASGGLLTAYYGGSVISQFSTVVRIYDGYDSAAAETMSCYILTKNYDFGQSSGYKKLAWWGADIYGTGEIDAQVSPVFLAPSSFTWAQIHGMSWSSLGTWLTPLIVDNSTTTQVISGGPPQRIFTKFLKAMRFRQIFFKLTMTTDGSLLSGPARIYSLTVVVGIKQQVPEIVN